MNHCKFDLAAAFYSGSVPEYMVCDIATVFGSVLNHTNGSDKTHIVVVFFHTKREMSKHTLWMYSSI